jgi:hypothetical protein
MVFFQKCHILVFSAEPEITVLENVPCTYYMASHPTTIRIIYEYIPVVHPELTAHLGKIQNFITAISK